MTLNLNLKIENKTSIYESVGVGRQNSKVCPHVYFYQINLEEREKKNQCL